MNTLALWAALALGQEPDRLRTLLPNGAALYVERQATAKSFAVVLVAETHGVGPGERHLLEHLVLRRPGLDEKAETQGVFFTGRTYRDFMQIEAVGPAGNWRVALEVMKEVLSPLVTTPEAIAREIDAIREELALRPDTLRLGDAAWKAFGDQVADPNGDPENMAKETPESLAELARAQFDAANVNLVIVGPSSVEDMTEAAKDWLGGLRTVGPVATSRSEIEPQRIETEDAFGEARAGRVGGLEETRTLATLAAALATASQVGEGFVSYTPSAGPGLVIVGRTESRSGLGTWIDETPAPTYTRLGRMLLQAWLRHQRRNPLASATWRAQLLAVNRSLVPEELEERAAQLDANEFALGFQNLKKNRAIIVSGGRR